jgi:hypothetical protein
MMRGWGLSRISGGSAFVVRQGAVDVRGHDALGRVEVGVRGRLRPVDVGGRVVDEHVEAAGVPAQRGSRGKHRGVVGESRPTGSARTSKVPPSSAASPSTPRLRTDRRATSRRASHSQVCRQEPMTSEGAACDCSRVRPCG